MLGVAHEPGYPLFTMLGHLFSCLSVGSIPFRVNLLSVICHGATVGVIYLHSEPTDPIALAALIARCCSPSIRHSGRGRRRRSFSFE